MASTAPKSARRRNTDTSWFVRRAPFPDGAAHSTVSASATDSDGDTGNTDTQDVTINNVAPTVVLTGAANVDEGSTHTYSFTVTDPGDDTFTAASGYPDCDAGGTDNGDLVPGSFVPTAHGGSFDCNFPDGPSSANVKMKVPTPTAPRASTPNPSRSSRSPTSPPRSPRRLTRAPTRALTRASTSAPSPTRARMLRGTSTSTGATAAPTPNSTSSATGALGTKSHTYADGPDDHTVTVTVTDKDHASDFKTFSVHVDNVAPTLTLDTGNDLSVDEGSTHTYSYTITDPGVDTVDHVTTDCGTNGVEGHRNEHGHERLVRVHVPRWQRHLDRLSVRDRLRQRHRQPRHPDASTSRTSPRR